MARIRLVFLACHLILGLFGENFLSADDNQGDREIYVCAAASLTEALRDMAQRYEQKSGLKIHLNLGSSRFLRLQIEKGLPCDLFIPAHSEEASQLVHQGFIDEKDVKDLLSNELVIISAQKSRLKISRLEDLKGVVNEGIVLADPETVPCGIYAKEALINAQLWNGIQKNIIPAFDVKAALLQVEYGNVPLGIVYRTDAQTSQKVKILLAIPAALHSPIHYPVCLIPRSSPSREAQGFREFLFSPEVKEILTQKGFSVL